MSMMRLEMAAGSVSLAADADDDGGGDCRIKGCTIRFGLYVLITAAAAGVHITWDCWVCGSETGGSC